jgi:hypothetical protein
MSLTPAKREELHREYLQKANELFESMFDEGRQEQLVTMTQREDCILKGGGELFEWLMARHLEQDSMAVPDRSHSITCPECGHEGVPDGKQPKPVPRLVTTRTGKLRFERRKYRCPHCRAVFFPPRP